MSKINYAEFISTYFVTLCFRLFTIADNLRQKRSYRIATILTSIGCIPMIFIEPAIIFWIALVWFYFVSNFRLAFRLMRKLINQGIYTPGKETLTFRFFFKKQNYIEYHFYNPGISINDLLDRAEEIGIALNITIASIEEHRGEVVIKAGKGRNYFQDPIYWDDSKLRSTPEVVVGDSIGKEEIWDLRVHPHALIGGSTGCGKTVLFKSILYQFIKKHYKVFLVDFKKGVDFENFWKDNCRFVIDKKETLEYLEEVCKEMDRRASIISRSNYSNIDEWNENSSEKITRIIVACDEISSLLDMVGLDKNERDETKRIQSLIIKIARLGRAFGIHLLLSTQRPDAKILSGDLKSNITYRLSGRADIVLSQIILDNSSANDIPKHLQGVFINHEGHWIKGYLMPRGY